MLTSLLFTFQVKELPNIRVLGGPTKACLQISISVLTVSRFPSHHSLTSINIMFSIDYIWYFFCGFELSSFTPIAKLQYSINEQALSNGIYTS